MNKVTNEFCVSRASFNAMAVALVHSEEFAPHTNDPQRSVSVLYFMELFYDYRKV